MALQFSHSVDHAFLEDNLLSTEDWVFQNDLMENDVMSHGISLENFGVTLGSDHLGFQDDSSSNSSTKSWNGLDDDFTSTIDVEVKYEPSSPSLSLGSTDSSTNQNWGSDCMKLESPPLTPPHEVVTPLPSPGLPQELPLNLVKGPKVSSAPPQNSYIIQNGAPLLSNGLHVVNGNLPHGAQLVNTNVNFVPAPNGLLIRTNEGAAPKVVMTTANGLPNGIKLHVVNSGTKRLANGTIKSGGRATGATRTISSALKRDAKGVTIHPPIVPKVDGIHMNTVPSSIATMTTVSAANAIVFSRNVSNSQDVKSTCQKPTTKGITVQPPSLSPQPPEDVKDERELMAWKRQQRMIKNRESASLSRKKKKEYVQTLEQKMQKVVCENNALKEENSALKKRLHALEEEIERLKSTSSSPLSGKYVTCLLTVILFVGINIAPFSLTGSNIQQDEYTVSSHHGRSLLAFEEGSLNESSAPSPADIIKDQYYNETLLRLHDESSQHLLRLAEIEQSLMMQQTLNISYMKERSEELSSRLMDALNRLSQDETSQEKDSAKESQAKPRRKTKKIRRERKKDLEAQAARWQMESDERSLQIYDSFFIRQYENLIDSLDRKHDTYYIVSFTRDHLLLPATSRNSTQRPKMSLVMPAGGNATMWNTPPDHMTMMQIDCEVTNTRTIYMPDRKEHVIQNETETPPSSVNDSNASTNHSSYPRSPPGSFETPPPQQRRKAFKYSRSKQFRAEEGHSQKSNLTGT